jgi:hypothetical protein
VAMPNPARRSRMASFDSANLVHRPTSRQPPLEPSR